MLLLCCDLLENSYLCGSNNNPYHSQHLLFQVVICLKIRTFAVATTTIRKDTKLNLSCDLLENSYLCGSNNNQVTRERVSKVVVICLKIRTFAVATTTEIAQIAGNKYNTKL